MSRKFDCILANDLACEMEVPWPVITDLLQLDAVIGGTLTKMFLETKTPTRRVYLTRKATTRELYNNCDGCVRQHQPNNTGCSMWLGKPTYATEFGALYDSRTKQPMEGWYQTMVDTRRACCVRRETWEKL